MQGCTENGAGCAGVRSMRFGGLAGWLVGAAVFCVLPAQGQAVPDEGYPNKPVFPEEPASPPALHEECGPLLTAGAFAEECTGDAVGDTDPGVTGAGLQGSGSSTAALDPALHTPPRLECPSAVFVEEMETGAIDCHVWDAAGDEHLTYFWEPIGGAARGYLENPRLLPENAPNPVVVAPSFPQYDTLESFLSEEGMQRHRYRLTATSRATGLSSHSEVEVFVLSSRPSVYCPLELEVEEGGVVALACEGADPLSFRMGDGDEAGMSPVLWEWAGLWDASTAPLAATDTPQPLFTAPEGSAGRTYHYVASMTTSSSGVSRTARRRVSVTVKAAESVAAPSITCTEHYDKYEKSESPEGMDFRFECEAEDAPEGVTYEWTGTDVQERLKGETTLLTPRFVMPRLPGGANDDYQEEYEYTGKMLDASGVTLDQATVSVTVKEKPDIDSCLNSGNQRVNEGGNKISLKPCEDGFFNAPGGPNSYRYEWKISQGSPTPSDAIERLSDPTLRVPVFTSPDDVQEDLLYQYDLLVTADNADPFVFQMDVVVNDLDMGVFSLACIKTKFTVHAGTEDISLECVAPAAPDDATWVWTAQSSTLNTDKLTDPNIRAPLFKVPPRNDDNIGVGYYYYKVSVNTGGQSQSKNVIVQVIDPNTVVLACLAGARFDEGDPPAGIGACTFRNGLGQDNTRRFRSEWRGESTTDPTWGAPTDIDRFVDDTLNRTDVHEPTFYVPEEVNKHEAYVYNRKLITNNPRQDLVRDLRVTVQVQDLDAPQLIASCEPNEIEVYAGDPDVMLDCKASGSSNVPYRYTWQAVPNDPLLLAKLIRGQETPTPTFRPPSPSRFREEDEDGDGVEKYQYQLTVDAREALPGKANVTITVLQRPPSEINAECEDPSPVYEGSPNFALNCSAVADPAAGSYTYVWEAHGATSDTDRLVAGTGGPTPTFDVPTTVDQDEIYEYKLTISAENAVPTTKYVTVTVLNRGSLTASCINPDPVYEGSPSMPLDCSVSGAPDDAEYFYVWEAQGATLNTNRLTNKDGPTPTFNVPDMVNRELVYEYRMTVWTENTDPATADIAITVLNKGILALSCTEPVPVYEGSPNFPLDCQAPDAPEGFPYTYSWYPQGSTTDTNRLTNTDGLTPTFDVPDNVSQTTRYQYRLIVTATPVEPAMAEVTVTVLNKADLTLACVDSPYVAYEGSSDIPIHCEATGAFDGADYAYRWEARGATPDTDRLLGDLNDPMQTFDVPDQVDQDETYEYLLTATATNADPVMLDVTVTVLNTAPVAVVCPGSPYEVYEGSGGLTLECATAGAPEGSEYMYAWEARDPTPDVRLLSAIDIISPTFATPDSVARDETYAYRLVVSAEYAESASADVTVTVLDRLPPPDPTSLGVTTSISALRFGVQSSDAQALLDPLSDRISTSLSGPYHAGRMMLSLGDTDATASGRSEKAVSIELVTPVTLRLAGEDVSEHVLALSPSWSVAESCEQLSSRSIGGLHTNVTLSESDCRMLIFGGSLDLSGAPSGRYSGNLDVVLRSGVGEETHSVEVEVTVAPPQRVTTIGPGGAHFDASRGAPMALTEEQNVSIYPDISLLTQDKPSGVFELTNPSLVPLEVSVSAGFGYTEATEEGLETMVVDPAVAQLGDLSKVVDIHPQTLLLMPGEQGVVRYGVREDALASLTLAGYAAFFEVTSAPRQYVRTDRLPQAVTGNRTGRVTMRIPGVYVSGKRVSSLRAELVSLSEGASLSATFLVEAVGAPFVGEVVAYDGNGRELGRRRTLVYTRSRVRVPLKWTPEDEVVFLRLFPSGSGQASEPVSVPWDAPRRVLREEVGAAPDRGQTPEGAALAGKP